LGGNRSYVTEGVNQVSWKREKPKRKKNRELEIKINALEKSGGG